MAKTMYVLCELENVLADISHRNNGVGIDKKDELLVAGDRLIFPTSRMLRGFARSGAEIVIVGQRAESFEKATKLWLKNNGIDYDWLYLKPDNMSNEVLLRRVLKAHKDDLLIAALVNNPLFQQMLQHYHQKPVLYGVQS